MNVSVSRSLLRGGRELVHAQRGLLDVALGAHTVPPVVVQRDARPHPHLQRPISHVEREDHLRGSFGGTRGEMSRREIKQKQHLKIHWKTARTKHWWLWLANHPWLREITVSPDEWNIANPLCHFKPGYGFNFNISLRRCARWRWHPLRRSVLNHFFTCVYISVKRIHKSSE